MLLAPQRFQALHHIVRPAAEIVVERGIVGVEAIVHGLVGGDRPVDIRDSALMLLLAV